MVGKAVIPGRAGSGKIAENPTSVGFSAKMHSAAAALCFGVGMLLAGVGAHAHEHPAGAPRHDMSAMWAQQRQQTSSLAVSLAADEQGRWWLAKMEKGQVLVSHSRDQGQSFSTPVAVNPLPEAILATGQNRPKIAARDGVVVVTWAQALPKVFAGHVRFARSTDAGRSFSAPQTINDNLDEIGHSFPTLVLGDGGRLAIAWLDGRDKLKAAGKKADAASNATRGSSIYYALSADGGRSFAANRRLAASTCECCRIGLAMTPEGVPVALWRHIFGNNIRDFASARLEPQASVRRASEDQWQVAACPHHGGDIAVAAQGRQHWVWFTGNPKQPGLYYRHADGETLGAAQPFGDAALQAGHPVLLLAGTQVWRAWREYDGQHYHLLVQHSTDQGAHWAAPQTLASTAAANDLPQVVSGAAQPTLAWHGAAEGLRFFVLGTAQ